MHLQPGLVRFINSYVTILKTDNMKLIFTIKYIGKTLLIMFTVLSIGKQENIDQLYFTLIVLFASVAYCVGSIEYQFIKKDEKQRHKLLIKPLNKAEHYN